jgi:hypothetical protein
MNNTRLQRLLTSVSLVTQAFGFSTLGSLMSLRGWSDSGVRIGGLLAVLTGTMFLVAAIAYWRACHRRTGERLKVPGIPGIPSNTAALAGLERLSARRPHHARYSHGHIADLGRELLARSENASSNSAAGLVALPSVC